MGISLGRATRIGPYDIIESIGQGAMGEVFLALDSRLSRRVAIKTISQASEADPSRKTRFVQEARAASALNHPNIVTIHDFGTEAGISYIVTELVDGESLRNVIHRGPVPLRRLLDIAIQIADALAAAHDAGIVHRDLKPENIMITRAGRVKLLDFGLAKPILANDPSRTTDEPGTQPGVLLGTVAYMSPEQARGNPAGFESDQFSFGVILHEMSTGHHPFQRNTPMETLLAVANFERPPFTPGPVALRKLIERTMAREPDKRFPRTSEIHERLLKIRREMPEAPKPALRLPALHLTRRVAQAAAAIVLVVALLGIAAWKLAQPRFADPMAYRLTQLSTSAAPELSPAWSPDDRLIAYSRDAGGVLQIFVRFLDSGDARQLTHSTTDCLFPFWGGSDSRVCYIAAHQGRPALWSVNTAGGAPELLLDNVDRAAMSPDGSLALLRNGTLWLREGQTERPLFRREALLPSTSFAFSPDRSKLLLAAKQSNHRSSVWIVPLHGSSPHAVFDGIRVRGAQWFPDSRRVLLSNQGRLWIGDTASDKLRPVTNGPGNDMLPAVSHRGDDAAFVALNARYVLESMPLDRTTPAAVEGLLASDPAWSAPASLYAYVLHRQGQ